MRRIFNFLACIVIVLMAMPATMLGKGKDPQVKYVFYMIGDGMGINEVVGAELYNKGTGLGPEEINFLDFPVRGFVTTHSANALVTDSAAGGTALASGVKTYNNAIGVDADKNPVSVLGEWVAASGKGVGVITSVGVNHATPASFYAHSEDRNLYEDIILQYIDSKVDFAAGGGILTQRGSGNDAAYFEQKAKDAGIQVYHGEQEWSKMSKSDKRVLCLSGKKEGELPYAINRKEDDTKLADFVSAGISYLESKYAKKGFFMMVEGGRIDNAGHGDDGATCFQEINDFAAAIDVVLAFYEKHPDETLIVVTADHETGGLMLGAGRYEMHPDRLKGQDMSADMLTRLFAMTYNKDNVPTWEDAQNFLREHLGLWGEVEVDRRTEMELKATYDRSYGKKDAEEERVVNMYSSNSMLVQQAIGYLNQTAGYGWSYGSHSGSPVGLYVKGEAAEAFLPARDNTDIAPIIAKVAGYDMK